MSKHITVADLWRMLTVGDLASLPGSAPVVLRGHDEALLRAGSVTELRAQELGGSLSELPAGQGPIHPQAKPRRVLVIG